MFQNDDFVEVYSKTTGEKQMIPRVWLGQPIGADFAEVPSARAVDAKADTVAAILEAVGDDKGKAAAALQLEQATSKPRKSLVEGLQSVIDAPPLDPSGDPDADHPQADGQKES